MQHARDRTAVNHDISLTTSRQDGTATATLQDHRYPLGTFAGLIGTPFVTAPTRAALLARMAKLPVREARFLDPSEFALLGAVCDRLLDQDGDRRIDVPGAIDDRLASGESDGWRYDALPDDGTAMKRGLAGFDEAAHAIAGAGFLDLSTPDRDRVIEAVQAGDPPGDVWRSLPARRFFEDLPRGRHRGVLRPPAGAGGDRLRRLRRRPRWQAIELGQREPREPEPLGVPG